MMSGKGDRVVATKGMKQIFSHMLHGQIERCQAGLIIYQTKQNTNTKNNNNFLHML